jgi:3-dehydroquinate dehydratase / shikimate dehydrogenase
MRTGKVCASVSGKTLSELVLQVREAEEFADLVEIRFDHWHETDIPLVLDHLKSNPSKIPVIATYRARNQGGEAPDEAALRKKFWQQLGDEFWAVDQEEDVVDSATNVGHTVLSYHDFGKCAENKSAIFDRLLSEKPSVIKYAYMAHDITDTIDAWKMLKTAEEVSQPAVIISMGEAGKITRVLGPAYGSEWTYGSIGKQTAPGQISVQDLVNLYRVRDIGPQTKVYGVVGVPVIQSLSPSIHNNAFAATEMDSVFLPLLVKDLASFMNRMVRRGTREVELNFAGFSVTMPHKLAIMEHLDEIDETAKAIGAVNTVRIDGDVLRGYNTDAQGFVAPLVSRLGPLHGVRAAIFGAGGAARACLYSLKKEGASAAIFARDHKKGEMLCEEFGADHFKIDDDPSADFDIVVNATPVGMSGETEKESPIDLTRFRGAKLVYDLVTSADPTPLLRDAKAASIETIGGIEMLVAQAVRQFQIWTGKEAPVNVMQEAAKIGALRKASVIR